MKALVNKAGLPLEVDDDAVSAGIRDPGKVRWTCNAGPCLLWSCMTACGCTTTPTTVSSAASVLAPVWVSLCLPVLLEFLLTPEATPD